MGFEENLMKQSSDELANHQKRMIEFIGKQEHLCGAKSKIPFCHNCNSDKVQYQELELPLITNNKRFKRVKLIGSICSGCGEEYVNEKEIRNIEEIVKLINSYCSKENDVEVVGSKKNCNVCESNNVDSVELEVLLLSNNSKIISVTVQEDCCKGCNAIYYSSEGDQLAMEHLRYFYHTQ